MNTFNSVFTISFVSGFLRLFLIWFLLSGVDSRVYGQCKIGENLILNFDIKGYPPGFPPEWTNVSFSDHSPTGFVSVPTFLTSYKHNKSHASASYIFLGVHNGKAAIFWAANYMMWYYAEIITPENTPLVIGNTKTVLPLRDFKFIKDYGIEDDESPSDNITFGDTFKGNVWMSCDASGNLLLDFELNTYENGTLIFKRVTKETVKIQNRLTAAQANAQAKVFSKNNAYKSLLEHYLTLKYEGWLYDRLYIPGSLNRIEVITSDNLGNPTKIRGHCRLKHSLSGDKYTNGWVDVLLENKEVYGVIFDRYKRGILTPRINHKKEALSDLQIRKMTVLQHRYMFNEFQKLLKEEYGVNGKVSAACIKMEVEDETKVKDKGYEWERDINGNFIETEHLGYDVTTKSWWKINNKCAEDIIVWGIEMQYEHNALTYKDNTVFVKANSSTYRSMLSRIANSKVLDNFSYDYFLKQGDCFFISFNHTPLNLNIVPSRTFKQYTPDEPQPATENEPTPLLAKSIGKNRLEVNSHTIYTGVKITKGNQINFKASGNIRLEKSGNTYDPNGSSKESNLIYTVTRRVDGFNHGALLGRIGDSRWFLIGSSKSIIADRDGELCLIVNDRTPSDNFGEFSVEYAVNAAPGEKSPNYSSVSDFDLKTVLPRKYSGTMRNDISGMSSQIKNTLSEISQGKYRLTGNWTNSSSTGKWDMTSNEVIQFNDTVHITFSGNATVRGQGLMETLVPLSFILEVSAGEIKGTWKTDPFYYSNSEQKGTINMK